MKRAQQGKGNRGWGCMAKRAWRMGAGWVGSIAPSQVVSRGAPAAGEGAGVHVAGSGVRMQA